MRTIRLAMLLTVSGLVTSAGAQSLNTTGTFTPAATFNPALALWVAVDPLQGAGTVLVDVRDATGSILAAPVSFAVEKIEPQAGSAKVSRLPKPSTPLHLQIDVKPYQNAPPVVRAAGVAGTQQQALAAVKAKVDEVKCVGQTCPVCYSLEQNAEVTLDTYPDVGGKAVRTAFHQRGESAGLHKSEWDRVGDDHMTRMDGRYYIKLHAANASGEGADAVSTMFSLPPGSAGVCR